MFRCGRCGKRFESGQAMGGHMKWHSKNGSREIRKESGKKQSSGDLRGLGFMLMMFGLGLILAGLHLSIFFGFRLQMVYSIMFIFILVLVWGGLRGVGKAGD